MLPWGLVYSFCNYFFMLLTCPMTEEIYEGLGALELGNFHKAEEHFGKVLQSQGSEKCLDIHEFIEAHNGMGAVEFSHRDLMEARRWYHEAKYLLNDMYKDKWPAKLSWKNVDDRPAMRNLMGHAHVHYAGGDLKKAREYYEMLLTHDKKDEIGAQRYLDGVKKGIHFDEI